MNKVLALLKIDVKELNNAAMIEANIRPLTPVGSRRNMSNAYAIFEQPELLSQILRHFDGSEQPISSFINNIKLNLVIQMNRKDYNLYDYLDIKVLISFLALSL